MLFKNRLLRLGNKFTRVEKTNRRRIREDELIKALQLLGAKRGSILLPHISLNNLGLSVSNVGSAV